ncbi:ImmA/IrrE family metallo-endopeptidase [Nonomuraea sp. NPDC049141]|uniref:ImmA/IrrE family metallo-endopeptidase n=1 Tax=Nonomuraea sp. NPDC049141 TaxID=3155500 RepID=UPI003409F313
MPEQTLPTTPGARIALLIKRSNVAEGELSDIVDLPDGVTVVDVLEDRYALSPTDLVVVADLLNVPATTLTGQMPIDRHLGVSLRIGSAEISDVPVEALEYADILLQHQAVLDSWLGEISNLLHEVPMSTDRYFVQAGRRSAERVRDALSLDYAPIPDLLGLVESLGFPIVFRQLPQHIHGLNIRDEREGRPSRIIVVSTRGPWTMQRYTIAHELCHALYDDKDQVIVDRVDLPDVLPELRAERFARHLLLPADGLRQDVKALRGAGTDWALVTARLMLRWGVSRKTLLRALVDDGLATQADLQGAKDIQLSELMQSAGIRDQWNDLLEGQCDESGSSLLMHRALEAFSRGWISVRVVAEILGQTQAETELELTAQGWL